MIWWSQSGQVRRAAEALTEALRAEGREVVFVEIRPVTPYPFPWNVKGFFGLFPETVLERPAPIHPLQIPDRDWDLVIVGTQVWFLRVSQPVAAFLLGPQARVLAGRRVLTLVACRNMWIRGWRRCVELVEVAGGRVTDRVVATHSGSVFASYFSTLAWMLTGRRDAIRPLPAAGIGEESFERLRALGRVLAERLPTAAPDAALLADQPTASVAHLHAVGEQIVGRLYFPVLARVIAGLSRPGGALRTVFAWGMLGFVLSALFTMAPLIGLARLFARRWMDPWVERFSRLPLAG